jgi:hypothetical protein
MALGVARPNAAITPQVTIMTCATLGLDGRVDVFLAFLTEALRRARSAAARSQGPMVKRREFVMDRERSQSFRR